MIYPLFTWLCDQKHQAVWFHSDNTVTGDGIELPVKVHLLKYYTWEQLRGTMTISICFQSTTFWRQIYTT